MQDKKKAEADRQKELNDLFAIAIKQPKVPPGEAFPTAFPSIGMVPCLMADECPIHCLQCRQKAV